jgi:hypothetical protein
MTALLALAASGLDEPERTPEQRAEDAERRRMRDERYRTEKQAAWDAAAAPFRAQRAANKAAIAAKIAARRKA